ncbi:MAG: hypothetical protein AAFY83_05935 [Pseudomonadota bacterium]
MTMNAEDFKALVGTHLLHITLAENRPGIEHQGLLRPASLARLAGRNPDDLLLRKNPVKLSGEIMTATLNHQRPLRAGAQRDGDFLDNHDLRSWAAQLDERVFLWPQREGKAFQNSLKDRGAHHVFSLDAERLFETFFHAMDIAPINTGNATRHPAKRGDWIYTPVSASAETFRNKRRTRGLIRGKDRVVEVSIRADIPVAALKACSAIGTDHAPDW